MNYSDNLWLYFVLLFCIIIVPGSGIQPENFGVVRQALNAREYHSGLSSVLPYGSTDFARFEAAVRALAQHKSRNL